MPVRQAQASGSDSPTGVPRGRELPPSCAGSPREPVLMPRRTCYRRSVTHGGASLHPDCGVQRKGVYRADGRTNATGSRPDVGLHTPASRRRARANRSTAGSSPKPPSSSSSSRSSGHDRTGRGQRLAHRLRDDDRAGTVGVRPSGHRHRVRKSVSAADTTPRAWSTRSPALSRP